jgi:hypothetical protein
MEEEEEQRDGCWYLEWGLLKKNENGDGMG